MALSSFTFNADTNVIQLTFDASTALTNTDLSNFVLQNASSSPTVTVSLAGSTITSGTSPTVVYQVTLSDAAILYIKSRQTIAYTLATTYISTTYPTSVTVPASMYAADITSPTFVSFSLFNKRILKLVADKPIFNIVPADITLYDSSGTPNYTVQLVGGTTTINPTAAYITLSPATIAALASTTIGDSTSTTFIELQAGAFEDWNANGVAASAFAVQATAVGVADVYSIPDSAAITNNLSVGGVSTLGMLGNVKITGGTAGQFVQTDGAGNLTFAAAGGGGSSVMYYSGTVNTVNAIAGTAEIQAVLPVGTVPNTGDVFMDTSSRSNNTQPIYVYINNGWRQMLTGVATY